MQLSFKTVHWIVIKHPMFIHKAAGIIYFISASGRKINLELKRNGELSDTWLWNSICVSKEVHRNWMRSQCVVYVTKL